jgi:hypothetical protein
MTAAQRRTTTTMSGRTYAAILLVIFLGIGAAALGVTVYNAGVNAGIAQVAEGSSHVVVTTPVAAAPYAGWGWGWGGPGFGIFGFFFFLFFLFIVFGLIRAVFGWGRWGRRGPGFYGRGWYGNGSNAWNDRVREVHDELHRTGGTGGTGGAGGTGGTGGSGQPPAVDPGAPR